MKETKMNDSNVETFQQLDMLDDVIVRLRHCICDLEDLKKDGTIKTKTILKDFEKYNFLCIKDWCDTIGEEIQWYFTLSKLKSVIDNAILSDGMKTRVVEELFKQVKNYHGD